MADTPQAANVSPMPSGVTDPNYKPPPGSLGNLTATQQQILDSFKKQLIESGDFVEERMGDATLLKFLRARKFDLAKAMEMLLDAEKWRKDFGVDDIMKDFDFKEKAEVDKFYPQCYHKTDKEGRPIYIERLGSLDFDGLYSVTTMDRQLKRLVYEYEKFINERLPACSEAIGHPVETSCTILDLDGVKISKFYEVKEYVKTAASIGQDRYPECMGKFLIVNAPWSFNLAWSIIKPWLDEVTAKKIQNIYQKDLIKHIDEENLPEFLGGKCKCLEGCSMSDAGPWNPKDGEGKDTETS